MNLPVAFTAALETAFNQYLALDPSAPEQMQQLQGKVIAIELIGLDMKLFVLPGLQRVHIMSHYDGEPDTTLRGTPLSLMRMGLAERSEQSLFSGAVDIDGDTHTGQVFSRILKQLDIDWEEHLSHLTGDVVAHQLGSGMRKLWRWGQQAGDSLLQDSAEYLEEEAELLAKDWEVDQFNRHVDQLRNDVDRLAARIQHLYDQQQSTEQ